MFRFDEKKRVFFAHAKDVSYIFSITDKGYLRHLYFGAKISETDSLELLSKDFPNSFSPICYEEDTIFSLDVALQEFPTNQRGDFRSSPIVARSSNGSRVCDFVYDSYSITDGEKFPSDMPHARYGGQTLTINLIDKVKKLKIELNYIIFEDCSTITRYVSYKNLGDEDIYLERAFSYSIDFFSKEMNLITLAGRPAFERNVEITPITQGVKSISSTCGASSHILNPFVALVEKDISNDYGNAYGFNLIYSGNFKTSIEKSSLGDIRVLGGINDESFTALLKAGESFDTPEATLTFSANGLNGLSQAEHDFVRAHILDERYRDVERPIVVNNWEATDFRFDTDIILDYIDKASEIGVDTFVLDDGWFGKRDDDTSGLGDWVENTTKLKGGLAPLIDRCKQKGIKFGLWFEPEMVSVDSDFYRQNENCNIGELDRLPAKSRHQLVLDFSNPKTVDKIFNAIAKILDNNDISYVKWDMNRYISDNFSSYLPPERQGEFNHRQVLGVYDLAERILNRYPSLIMEGCAGGGGRFDLGMLYYFPQIWTSDNTDALERTKIQYGTSLAYPLIATSCHVTHSPNALTQRQISWETRFAIASLGAFGYELDVTKLTDEEKKIVREQIAEYKTVRSLVKNGDLFRIFSPFSDGMFCVSVVSKDKDVAYVAGMKWLDAPNNKHVIIKLKGLDDNKNYFVKELGLTLSGKYLKNVGLPIKNGYDFAQISLHLSAVKKVG